jgi:EAL domain-containing protein (putative c-di-GMP-specific phosphodiesterase class I)
VSSSSGRCYGYEALLRSSHPKFEGPEQVLIAAQALERNDDLADVVWARAAQRVETIPDGAMLFLNIDPLELAHPERLANRAAWLTPWASRVVIELTEHNSVTRCQEWKQSLAFLARAGFRLAVDDLGSGYSSLSLLAEIQPDFIKIDMSIIRGVHESQPKQRLVGLLCRFASASGAKVIAEGIECEEEARVARQLGADLLQGFLLGRPATSPLASVLPRRAPGASRPAQARH